MGPLWINSSSAAAFSLSTDSADSASGGVVVANVVVLVVGSYDTSFVLKS